MVRYFDLRLFIIGVINMVKPEIGGGGGVTMTWSKLFTYLLVLAVFSFVSIEVPLTLSPHTLRIRVRFGNRPVFTAVSVMASLVLPARVFWYVYLIGLLFRHTPRLVIPVNQDIFITTTVAVGVADGQQDLEANMGAQ